MIEYINGKIVSKNLDTIIMEINGIGYIINVSSLTLNKLPNHTQNTKIYISESTNMYSGTNTWYGFLTKEERDLFEVIKSIQKIGSKGAIDILSKIDNKIAEFKVCIKNKDSEMMCSIFGFTKKKSDKLILGLKDKTEIFGFGLDDKNIENLNIKFSEQDAIEALKSLGYSSIIAKKTINKILKECEEIKDLTIEGLIKEALKNI